MRRWTGWGCVGLVLLGVACGPAPRVVHVDPDSNSLSSDEEAAEYRAVARAAYARGVFLAAQGDLLGSLREHAQSVRLAPAEADLRLAYAQRLVEVGRGQEAAAFLEAAARRFGGSAGEDLLLGRLELAAGRLDEATVALDRVLTADSTRAEGWELRGRVALDRGELAAAGAALERAAALGGAGAELDEARAQCAHRQGDNTRAIELLQRVITADPERVASRRALAALLREAGRMQEAQTVLREALTIAPQDPDAIEAALESYVEGRDLEGAARLLQPYHARDELGPRLDYLYGRVLLQLDRWAEADSVLRPLAGLDGVRGIEPLLGDIAARAGKAAEARDHYRRALEQQPEDCTPAASLALLLAQEERRIKDPRTAAADSLRQEFAAAAGAAEKSIGPEDYRCHLLLGLAYSVARRFAEAIPHLETAHRLDPEDPEGMFNLAMAHQELGDYDQALELARRLLERDPDNPAAQNFVGYALAERGRDLPEAEALIRKALTKEPKNGAFMDSLGWVLYQQGKYAAAVTALERAVRLTVDGDALILEHLGDAYVRAGRLDAARRAYRRSRELDPARTALVDKLAAVEAQLRKH